MTNPLDATTILENLDAHATITRLHRDQSGDLPLGLPVPPPAADPAMFYGLPGELVKVADPSTEADPVGVLVSALSACGAVIGPGPYVQIGNTRHPLLIWPLLFGRTGSGRKGQATDTAEIFLHHAGIGYGDLCVTGLSSGEGLIERIRDPDSPDDPGGTMDKRLSVTEPEFSTVMARAKREGSTLGTMLRQAWDGRTLAVLTRNAYRASNPHIAIIGHITPKEFRMRLAEADMAGGSYNRFLPVYVERSKRLPIPEGVAPDLLARLSGRLHDAVKAARQIKRIALDEDARAQWSTELYEEFTAADDEDHAWTEFTRRSAPYCLRIAALYAALDARTHITTTDLGAAAALVRYSIASAVFVLDKQMRDPKIDRIRRALDQAAGTGMTRSEISALFSRNVPKQILDELLTSLTATGQYETFTTPTGGRPSLRYRRTSPDEQRRNKTS
ncbi:DUF3987 domain-containing protein [Nonomuraea spiralis]|uniref:DUF3987 domain-containing protein n=1 Tax=Nonomuraea spiralis TaxID=46182 RepID=A0ABV5IPG9_9ACTN|nr:DUF3987 domain-containing protein [Nonomuraea spiralis]GGT38370.1 hypothetical protein GCM10010176_098020 [Nonomuraea spiralis]